MRTRERQSGMNIPNLLTNTTLLSRITRLFPDCIEKGLVQFLNLKDHFSLKDGLRKLLTGEGGHVYSEKIYTVLTAIFPNLTNKHMKRLAGKSKQGSSSKGYSLIKLTVGIIVTSMKPKQFHNITRYAVVVRTPKS